MSDTYHKYFEKKRSSSTAPIDDSTANDLDLDQVFGFLDSTRSTPGQAVLYGWLRSQCDTLLTLDERRTFVKHFREDPDARRKVEKALLQLGKQLQGDVIDFLWKDTGNNYVGKSSKFRTLVFAEVLVFLSSLFLGWASLFVLFLLSIVNLGIYLKTTKYIGKYTSSIAYLGKMLMATRKISKSVGHGTTPDHQLLGALAKVSSKVPFTITLFLPTSNIVGDLVSALFEYYRIFLLGEIRAYFSFHEALSRNHEDLKKTFELVGKIDASLCILDIEDSNETIATPVFLENSYLKITDMVHPLVSSFVPLSVSLEKGAIVTGTNMAGKSTFLRTLGINQILATTIKVVLAKEFHTCFARVMSALEISDDLVSGKSRYLTQAERILKVISACEQGLVLALIDEILSGTNSNDRIKASISILRYLSTTKSIIISSTHDLEIAESIKNIYVGLYFSEILGEKGLEFDYKIHQGIVDRSNAIRILAHLGFSRYLNGLG